MKKILCIGGPKDGHWVEDRGKPQQFFAIHLPLPTEIDWKNPPMTTTVKEVMYRKEQMRCEHDRWYVLVYQDWSMFKALNALIEGYRRP